jgi:hypothetical protein
MAKASGRFFEKKRRKKLLFALGQGGADSDAPEESKVFYGFFLNRAISDQSESL